MQVRYGQLWAPKQPDDPAEGVMTEILLAPGEYFTHMDGYLGIVIDAIQFTSNLQTYTKIGGAGGVLTSVPLNRLLYFSGAAGDWSGARLISQLAAHTEKCEAP